VDNVSRLQDSKPELHRYLASLGDSSVLPMVADHVADSLGSTRKFVDFVLRFLPEPPASRPPEWAQFRWESDKLKKSLRAIYGYRSKALHDGKPFPAPMCRPPTRVDPSWSAPAEIMLPEAVSEGGSLAVERHPDESSPVRIHNTKYFVELVEVWCTHKQLLVEIYPATRLCYGAHHGIRRFFC
jgi:hypothetical protein